MIVTDTHGDDMFINTTTLKVELISKVEYAVDGKDETCVSYVNGLPDIKFPLDLDGHTAFCEAIQERYDTLYEKGLVFGQIEFMEKTKPHILSGERSIKVN